MRILQGTRLTACQVQTDGSGIVNNILLRHQLSEHHPTISSVAPASTTAALAGQVPHESQRGPSSELPGQFPETPANEPQSFSVNPIPASSGAGNPVSLAPGEKVPHPSSYTAHTLDSNVKLDQESYERGAGNPLIHHGQEQREAEGASIFGLPAIGGTMIPESSLPMGNDTRSFGDMSHTVSSVAPQSTTAELAGQQPIEPRVSVQDTDSKITSQPQQSTGQVNGVPELVTESQQQAHFAPEASANPTAVREKAAVEKELERKVSPVEEAGVPVPTESAALSSTAPAASSTTDSTPAVPTGSANTPGRSTLQTPPQDDSRDVSPMTRAEGDSAMSTTPAVSAAPSTPKKSGPLDSVKNTPDRTAASDTGSPADSKKSKRKSFFGRIKEKLRS
ncbi:hypothetical protein ANO11243_090630 [Dothideomycetidae sp. 11243]|nr:hypothetical protein ANO11243_090630 [fungal sp. No.11243]